MLHLMLVYLRSTGQVTEARTAGSMWQALELRFIREAQLRVRYGVQREVDMLGIEVVTLSASSLERLRTTHGRYFFGQPWKPVSCELVLHDWSEMHVWRRRTYVILQGNFRTKPYLNHHDIFSCKGEWCSIHRPKPGVWDSWPLLWRSDTRIMERVCPHGCGHPAVEQLDHWAATDQMYQAVHGCCGCPCR